LGEPEAKPDSISASGCQPDGWMGSAPLYPTYRTAGKLRLAAIALETARDGEIPAPLSALARELWATARPAAGPGQDHTRLIRWLEQAAKAELRDPPWRSGCGYSAKSRSVQTPPRELDSTAAVMNLTPRAPSSTLGTRRASGSGSRPSSLAAISSAQPV
jgi:hypothetical protein